MEKEDLVLIATHRRLGVMRSILWQKKLAFLEALIGGLSIRETEMVRLQKEKRLFYKTFKLSELKNLAKRFRIPFANRNRNGIIDELFRNQLYDISPTSAQKIFIEKWGEPSVVLSGKKGTGKSFALCALIQKIHSTRPNAKILLLTRSKDSEKKCEKFLYYLGVPLQPIIRFSDDSGCFCTTMEKWNEMDPGLPQWDWILVDDADILSAEGWGDEIRGLCCSTNHYIATETHLDSSALVEHSSPSTCWLSTNLRSSEEIIYILNWLEREYICKENQLLDFSAFTPPNRMKKGSVYFCSDPGLAGEFMTRFPPRDAFAIGAGESGEAKTLLQYIKAEKPEHHVIILNEKNKNSFQDEPIYIITSLSIARGTERACTVVLANSFFSQEDCPTFRKAIITLYEACACAKTDLVIVISPQLERLVFGHLPNRAHLKRKTCGLSRKNGTQEELNSNNYQFPLYGHRSNTIVGYIRGAYLRQMDQKIELSEKLDLARAEVAMREGLLARERISYRLKHWTYKPEDIFISIDTEDDGKGVLTEIAAMAFTMDGIGKTKIVDVFHRLTEGVSPNRHAKISHSEMKENFNAEAYTALIFSDRDKIQSHEPLLLHDFHDWHGNIRQWNGANGKKIVFLHWGGSEAKLFDIESETFDVAQMYKTWLEHTDQLRSFSLTLENAVHHLLGTERVKFVPHRALEDATMTASVFYVMADI